MTTQELRIAKLSRILNNSSLNQDLANPAIHAAYKRAYDDLQTTIKGEKDFHQETEARQRVQHSIEKQEEQLKESMRKHHFNVLKKQIEDRKKQKQINEIEKLLERPKSIPKTPPEPPKFFVREGLKDQIREKRKKIKDMQKSELDYDRFLIKVAKNSLDEDIKKKRSAKDQAFEQLKDSWKESKTLNTLKKQADRLQNFANSGLNQTVKSPKNKVKVEYRQRNKTTENTPIKSNFVKEKIAVSEVKKGKEKEKELEKDLKLAQGEEVKKLREENHQDEEVKRKLERIDKRTKEIEKQKQVLKKLQDIEEYEQSVKQEKRLILDYLASKGKKID